MLIKDVLHKTTQFFKQKGFESARLDAELLLSEAMTWDRVKLYMNYEYPLSSEELEKCRDLVKRRSVGEPVAYILGKKEFFKSTFIVRPGVLIPRPETEHLVEAALSWARKASAQVFQDRGPRLVDFGCGSGCLGLSALKELPTARLASIDASRVAVDVTRANAERLGVTERLAVLHQTVESLQPETMTETLGGQPDLILANPPYISPSDPQVDDAVKAFEPREALFSDDNGLGHIKVWTERAADLLVSGGLYLCEIGSGQGRDALRILKETSRYKDVEIHKDISGHDRFIQAIRL